MTNFVHHSAKLKLRKTCLLIDDDEDDSEFFCIAVREVDPAIECFFARDGMEGLKMLEDRSFSPDYIFLDLNMPLMSGKECLAEIRKRPHLSDIPVIIFSTSGSHKDISDTRILGASYFITKPPLLSTLTQKLLEVFDGNLRQQVMERAERKKAKNSAQGV